MARQPHPHAGGRPRSQRRLPRHDRPHGRPPGRWNPARSRVRLAATPKRHLADPSLAVAALGATPQRLLGPEIELAGFLEAPNGRWLAAEIKLGHHRVDQAAHHLLALEQKLSPAANAACGALVVIVADTPDLHTTRRHPRHLNRLPRPMRCAPASWGSPPRGTRGRQVNCVGSLMVSVTVTPVVVNG
jgi:hypothetical protein